MFCVPFFLRVFIIIIKFCNGSSCLDLVQSLVNTCVLLELSVDVGVEGQQIFAESFSPFSSRELGRDEG